MADKEIQKTLNNIAKTLADINKVDPSQKNPSEKSQISELKETVKKQTEKQNSELKEALNKNANNTASIDKTTQRMLKGTGKETQPVTAAQNEQDKTATAVEKGVLAANKKTYPVDFWSNFASSWKGLKTGLSKISKGFKDLGKALGLDKIKKVTGGFWDFLKKLISIGFVATGIIKFIEGWNKANKWFEGNVGFGERLASALANILGSVLGWEEDDKQNAAKKIAKFFNDVGNFLSKEFTAFKTTMKELFEKGAFKDVVDGVKLLLDGDFKQSFEKLKNGISAIIGGIWDTESILLKIFGVYFGAKLVGKIGKAIFGLGKAFGSIARGLWDTGAAITDITLGKKSKGKGSGAPAGKRTGGIKDLLKSSIKGLAGMGGLVRTFIGPLMGPLLIGAGLIGLYYAIKNMPKTTGALAPKGEVNDETISAFKIEDGGLSDDPSLVKKLPNGENAYAVVKGTREGKSYEMAVDQNRFNEIEALKAIMNDQNRSDDVRIQAIKQLDNLIVQFTKAQNPVTPTANTPSIIQGENSFEVAKAVAQEQDKGFKKLGIEIIKYKQKNEASDFFKKNLQFQDPKKMIAFLREQQDLIENKERLDPLIKVLEEANKSGKTVQQANIDQRQTLTNIFSSSRGAGSAALVYNN